MIKTRGFLLLIVLLAACQSKPSRPFAIDAPVSAEDALLTFQLAPGFKVELIAAEPLIADPVAMEIDENGNLYVVENHGYPLDNSKSSKVKLLRDTDGDGRMDTSTIFADTLLMPTGIMRWKQGIIVTDAPDVLYMEDTDNDGRADIIKPILTGFAMSNPQHNVNTPIYGLDNWIYIAHERGIGSEVYKELFGDKGSEVRFAERPNGPRLPQNANGRNVRVRPDTWELEMLASTTQYGHTFDVWGNHLLVNNSNHLIHEVIPAGYLNRNPALVVPRGTSLLSDHGNAAEVFPITTTPDRQLLTDVGVMTSACAITAYTGGAFGEDFDTNITFVAEPVANIVHADRLKPKGSTFVGSRVLEKSEFFASTDMWCRPVNLYIGPDGALYIVDYYREIIEHPEWLSNEVINSGRIYNGHDMGRIFRVSRTDAGPADWTTGLSFGTATDEQLVEKLASPNIWWRRTAQRMILDRGSQNIASAVVKMAANTSSAAGRLHALWTLEGLGALTPDQIEIALKDTEAGVRTNAIKLAELYLEAHPTLTSALLPLEHDSDAKVRFQLLCTLGFVDTPEARDIRDRLLFRDIEDEFVQVAALSAPSSRPQSLLESVVARYDHGKPAYGALVRTLAAMIAANEKELYGYTLLKMATNPLPADSVRWHAEVLRGFARGLNSRSLSLSIAEQELLFDAFRNHPATAVREASLQVLQSQRLSASPQLERARLHAGAIARDNTIGERDRALAIAFLALRNPAADAPFLKSLILQGEPLPVQLAAIKTLNAIPDETVTEFSMANWEKLDPAVQDAALNAFMEKESRVRLLIEALETGMIEPSAIGWARSIRLMTQRDIALRDRARAFFENDEERKNVIDEYQAALTLKGNVANGKAAYQRSCAICHQIKGKDGIPFGPDLGTIQSWPASGIMANILDPNQSISHGFDLWNVALQNGESRQGVITDETPSSVTVRTANGQVSTIAREEIISQKALNMSAMPVGLEKEISLQEMADLLAYLRDEK